MERTYVAEFRIAFTAGGEEDADREADEIHGRIETLEGIAAYLDNVRPMAGEESYMKGE